MASALRLTWLIAIALCALSGGAQADELAPSDAFNPVPSQYSLSYDKDRWSDAFSVFHMAVAEQWGLVGSGFAASDDPRLRPLTRLDTSWNLTAPLLSVPARLGDGVSSAGFWDQPARIGGIQIGTFQPVVPDVVVPPSMIVLPYEVAGPTLWSNRFVDQTRSFVQYQAQSLVSAGQADYSMESGRLRENFEVRSGDYGPWLTSGTYRYGINATTTLNGQVAEVTGQQSYVGMGVLQGFGALGLMSANVASSRDPDCSGWLARMGYDFSRDRISFALRSHIQSEGFQDVGDSSTLESFRQRTLAAARLDLGSLGKVSLASATQTYGDDSRRDVIALSHAVPFGFGGIVSTAAAYSPGPLGNSALLLSFTYPFDYFTAPSHKVNGALTSALDRTIVDAFGQTRMPIAGHPGDKSTLE